MLNTISPSLINDGDQSPTESTLLHPYPGSMPAYLASRLIDQYSNKGDIVFDPFCGSGTVLTEALRLKRSCIGADLLESSVSIAKIAVSIPKLKEVEKKWEYVKEFALSDASLFSNRSQSNVSNVDVDNLAKWLHPETLSMVLKIRNLVDIDSDNKSEAVIALILASSLISLSKRVSRGVLHWGWIADNVIPKPNDLYIVDPFQEIDRRIKKLTNFISATGGLNISDDISCNIKNINWLDYKDEFSDISVDLLITSPPYPYSIDYTLAQRLTHYLFNKDYNSTRQNEIGARYKRKRKNRKNEYLNELRLSLRQSSKHVKTGGKAVFVLPHPKEYKNILNFTEEEWLQFINSSLKGNWKLQEYGIRKCAQRRVVNKSLPNREEIIIVCVREE